MRRCILLVVALLCPQLLFAEDTQIEFTAPVNLLSPSGDLEAWGWARRAHMIYNRDAVPAEQVKRIKEWEHYTVMSPKFMVGVTVAHIGTLAFGSVEVIDYAQKQERSSMFFGPTAKGRSLFPATPYGNTEFRGKESFIRFNFDKDRRRITFNLVKTDQAPAFVGELELVDDPAGDNIAITRPFAKGEFFYEDKIFGMPATGKLQVGEATYELPAGETFAIFDWGRGIWPRSSQWFWGQGAGIVDGKRVAINLGHGYGDDSRGTANAILVNGKLHKLRDVACEFDPDDRMKPWKFTSDDGRLTLDFVPIYNQHAKQEALVGASDLHKIHGHYSGKLVVDGQPLEIKNLLGFAEHMSQRW